MVVMARDDPSPLTPSLRLGLSALQPSTRHHAQSLLGPSFHEPRTPHVLESRILSSHNLVVVLFQDCRVKTRRWNKCTHSFGSNGHNIRSFFDVGLGCAVDRMLNAARKTSANTLITTRLSQWCISLLEVRRLFSARQG